MREHTETTTSKDGTQIFVRMMTHPEASATLLFVHGYGEHSGRYQHVLEFFHAKGYDVAAFDYRGHGRAQGTRGHVERFSQYSEDVDAFIRLVTSRATGDRRTYLIGHSLGGLIVANYLLEHPEGIDGMVLSSPFLGLKMKVPALKVLAAKGLSSVLPTFALPTNIPPEALSTDPAVGVAYTADPLVGKSATARWFTESMKAQETVLRRASLLRMPALLLIAGADSIADPEVSQSFLAALGSSDKELEWYDGMYHEIFNEREKLTVFNALASWLEKRR